MPPAVRSCTCPWHVVSTLPPPLPSAVIRHLLNFDRSSHAVHPNFLRSQIDGHQSHARVMDNLDHGFDALRDALDLSQHDSKCATLPGNHTQSRRRTSMAKGSDSSHNTSLQRDSQSIMQLLIHHTRCAPQRARTTPHAACGHVKVRTDRST